MDAGQVALLREMLAGTEWLRATRRFAGTLRSSIRPHGGLLLVGSERYEPWHLAAHLADEAAWSGLPELSPTLVRHRVPPTAPAHLAVDLSRVESAGRRETLLVVSPGPPGDGLLERLHDARRAGATVLALESRDAPGTGSDGAPHAARPGSGAPDCGRGAELRAMAHEALTADAAGLDLEIVQHLVSAAAGESGLPLPGPRSRRRFRDRLSRLADCLTAPPEPRW